MNATTREGTPGAVTVVFRSSVNDQPPPVRLPEALVESPPLAESPLAESPLAEPLLVESLPHAVRRKPADAMPPAASRPRRVNLVEYDIRNLSRNTSGWVESPRRELG
ncbi:hypothetical protein Raf01_66260 [Rugosimonospora africana]|uniref:Uncharacterized protein n=1 Tax=Rugosimonospora africana TaxID=556532 RepID=A0A8J3QWK0_9ACTN|nr:hypothetical protein Raf01_66260 [Rugosimonospora africana]